jgi:hypothetical protein
MDLTMEEEEEEEEEEEKGKQISQGREENLYA